MDGVPLLDTYNNVYFLRSFAHNARRFPMNACIVEGVWSKRLCLPVGHGPLKAYVACLTNERGKRIGTAMCWGGVEYWFFSVLVSRNAFWDCP